jgi:hypothetical protein
LAKASPNKITLNFIFMKKTASFLLICVLTAGIAFAQPASKPATKTAKKTQAAPVKAEPKAEQTPVTLGPSIKWAITEWNFGTVAQNVPASKEFEFTNTGTVPVLIENVSTSCGCTAPVYTKEPVMPGKKGTIKLTFNAAAVGQFHKTASVKTSIAESMEILTIKGNVEAPAPVEAPKQ